MSHIYFSHEMLRINFTRLVMLYLPNQWKAGFRANEALEFYSLDDYIGMTAKLRSPGQTRAILELCIRASLPDDWEMYGSTPIAVLKALRRINTQYILFPSLRPYLAEFDAELYVLARSNKCNDSQRILELFCTRPARIIQYTWKRYQKRQQASRIIQEYVRIWLYRPGGPMMKKAEASFYSVASKQ